MKYKGLLYITICLCFMSSLLTFPSLASEGVKNGLELCATIIIPSIFPFTVVSLILFSIKIGHIHTNKLNKLLYKTLGLNLKEFCIFCLSHLGGYPVGAKLIDDAYANKNITRKNAEIMLSYCINSGPSFTIIVIGNKIWHNQKLGILLYISTIVASLTIAMFSRKMMEINFTNNIDSKDTETFQEKFVNATYNATESIFKICSAIVVFSVIIKLCEAGFSSLKFGSVFLSTLEITNGIMMSYKNLFLTAFLVGFGGVSVHFQALSICNQLKPSYVKIFVSRILNGVVTSATFYSLLKIFKVSAETLSASSQLRFDLTKYSVIFSVMLFICGILFIVTTNKKDNCI